MDMRNAVGIKGMPLGNGDEVAVGVGGTGGRIENGWLLGGSLPVFLGFEFGGPFEEALPEDGSAWQVHLVLASVDGLLPFR
jgi:hypothetical protein